MILQNNRLQNIIDNIIKESLQKGILPNSEEFLESLNNQLKNKDLTKPLFKAKDTKYNYSIDDYNVSKKDLSIDFNIFFNTIIILYNELQNNILKYESLKKNKEKLIEELNNELKVLLFKFSPNEYLDRFNENLLNFDFISDNCSALVNIINHEVSLPKNISKKVLITKDNISIDAEENQFTYNEYEDGKVFKITVDKKRQDILTTYINIDLKEYMYISNIDLSFSFIKPCTLYIYTDDNNIFTDDIQNKKSIEINGFVKNIKLGFRKTEADKVEKSIYKYIIYINEINIYRNTYLNYASFESKDISLPDKVDLFKFVSDDYCPAGTRIEYSFKTNNIENWIPIKNDSEKVLASINKKTSIQNNYKIQKEYDEEEVKRNKSYILLDIANEDPKDLKVYSGYNMWKRDIFNIQYTTEEIFDINNLLTIINGLNPISSEYIDITEKFGLLLNTEKILLNKNELNISNKEREYLNEYLTNKNIFDTFVNLKDIVLTQQNYIEVEDEGEEPKEWINKKVIRWTSNVYCEETMSSSYSPISNNIDKRIYINGILSNNQYIFNKGWNKIEIYGIDEEPAENNAWTLIVPFPNNSDFKYILYNILPFEEVDYQYLRFGKDININSYAIKDNKDIENPHKYILLNNPDNKINYLVAYQPKDNSTETIKIKADLYSSNIDKTPKFYSYQLLYK